MVVGAGHAGLAVSRFLSARSVDHLVLERGEVANSWRRERWDSLRLLTPNWLTRLPDHPYQGPDPDGYMTAGEVADLIGGFATATRAPVRTGTEVTSVRRRGRGTGCGPRGGEISRGRWSSPAARATSRLCRRSRKRCRTPSGG